MATPRDKYYTELNTSITNFNNRNGAPLSNDNIQDAINIFIVEEESEAHNVTVYNFCQTPVTPNTQGEN